MMTGCACFGNFFSNKNEPNPEEGESYSNEILSHSQKKENQAMKYYHPVHADGVNCVAAVQKGICLSGSKDEAVAMFDFDQGREIEKWKVHEKEVTKVIYGSSIGCCFSASRDKTIAVLQPGNTGATGVFTGHNLVVTAIALNEENTHLCSGSRDNSIRLWDIKTQECIKDNVLSRNLITHLFWSPSEKFIAQTGEDKELKLWDSESLHLIKTFPKKQYIQTWCEISADSQYCLTCSNGFGGNGCEATLWDLRMGSILHEYRGHYETTSCGVFLPTAACGGRQLLATCSNDCSIRVWDQNTAQCLCETSLPGAGPLTSIAVYEDASVCISSLNTGIHLLQIEMMTSGGVNLQEKAQF